MPKRGNPSSKKANLSRSGLALTGNTGAKSTLAVGTKSTTLSELSNKELKCLISLYRGLRDSLSAKELEDLRNMQDVLKNRQLY